MTDSPPLFEEMLAAYPADKREFARRVYDRFANGDATEFSPNCFCCSTCTPITPSASRRQSAKRTRARWRR